MRLAPLELDVEVSSNLRAVDDPLQAQVDLHAVHLTPFAPPLLEKVARARLAKGTGGISMWSNRRWARFHLVFVSEADLNPPADHLPVRNCKREEALSH